MLFLSSVDFFSQLFRKILSEIPSVSNKLDPEKISGLIWIQSVSKNCQQITLGGKKLRIDVTCSVKLNNIFKKIWVSHSRQNCDVSTKKSMYRWYLTICYMIILPFYTIVQMRFTNTFKNEPWVQIRKFYLRKI